MSQEFFTANDIKAASLFNFGKISGKPGVSDERLVNFKIFSFISKLIF
jgi:hypothetical protein